jgi:hypothetical protein
MAAGDDAAAADLTVAASVMIGTKAGDEQFVGSAFYSAVPIRFCRRHPNTCWGQTCQRRATSGTRAPGASVLATIRAFSSSDQRRRHPGPVSTSTGLLAHSH